MFATRLVVACNYFITILKYYPYKKLEEYVTYDRYRSVFIKLVLPYIRKYFYMLIMKMKIIQRLYLLLIMEMNTLIHL